MNWCVAAILMAASAGLACGQNGGSGPPAWQPLDSAGRWHQYLGDTWASPGFYAAALVTAADSQLSHDPPEWRLGSAGFAERTASWIGVFGIQETLHQAGAAAMGYDPRYLVCQCRGFFRRTGHALKWSLVTKNAAGETRPDIPIVAGAYGSGIVSTYWYPARYRPLSDGVRAGNEQMVFVVAINVIKEFGPELKRAFRPGH